MNEVMKSLNDSSKALGKLLEKNMDALLKENVELKAQLADALMAAYVDAGHRDVAEESESVANARVKELEGELEQVKSNARHYERVLQNRENFYLELKDAKTRIAELEAQLAEAKQDYSDKNRQVIAKIAEINSMRRGAEAAWARGEVMRAALEMVEWVSTAGCDHSALECPWCDELEYPNGRHADDCARQAALNPTPTEPPQVFPWKDGDMLRAELEEE